MLLWEQSGFERENLEVSGFFSVYLLRVGVLFIFPFSNFLVV